MFRYEFHVIEELKEKKGNFSASIIRSIYYKTIEEAEAKLKALEPKENGILKIEKKLVF